MPPGVRGVQEALSVREAHQLKVVMQEMVDREKMKDLLYVRSHACYSSCPLHHDKLVNNKRPSARVTMTG